MVTLNVAAGTDHTFEIVLKLAELFPEDSAAEALSVYLAAFIERF